MPSSKYEIPKGLSVRSAQAVAGYSKADGTEGQESFRWVITTEAPVKVFDWDRLEVVDEILLVPGGEFGKRIPLLDSHNRSSSDDLIGSVTGIEEGETSGLAALLGNVEFSKSDPKAQRTRAKVEEGHLTDGSIGYDAHSSVWIPDGQELVYQGKSYSGPLKLTYGWRLLEFSTVPIGADQLAKLARLRK